MVLKVLKLFIGFCRVISKKSPWGLAGESFCLPQESLRVDRSSTYKAIFDAKNLEEALKSESRCAIPVMKKAIKGAEKFMKGQGRHGSKVEESKS
ncbi:hypothetical protein HNY73_000314 [Argiope bruennichi]|uniref:Uncharacterized protein n=1 Tax=Argiope bruennichi TaxID=94029 RepID=A0A8T0G3P4_ARGBR|nr:hypothetical protein HNY73_000314 [Argiope bruennichi]